MELEDQVKVHLYGSGNKEIAIMFDIKEEIERTCYCCLFPQLYSRNFSHTVFRISPFRCGEQVTPQATQFISSEHTQKSLPFLVYL